MATTTSIRVLIADDFKILRDVIRLYLESAEDIKVVDEALDLDDAVERARTMQPDVIIMNDYLPPLDGARAAAFFRDHGIPGAVLLISMNLEPDLMSRAFVNGVNGFMHKDEIDDFLIEAVRHVYQGERYLSPKAKDAYNNPE